MFPTKSSFVKSSISSLLLFYGIAAFQQCCAGEPIWKGFPVGSAISASLATGRVINGNLDSRTTNEQLWLTIDNEGISISSLVPAAEVKAVVLTGATRLPAINVRSLPNQSSTSNLSLPSNDSRTSPNDQQAQSLSIFAHLDNWNGDPKPDGIRLYLSPRGADGRLVPVAGSISVQLSVYRGDVRDTSGRYREEESWSYEISTSDYDRTGASVTLPFRRIQPESDRAIFTLATINVRFKIAGQGVLDATMNDVELRNRSYTDDIRLRR